MAVIPVSISFVKEDTKLQLKLIMRWKLILEASQNIPENEMGVTHTCHSMGGDYTELGTALVTHSQDTEAWQLGRDTTGVSRASQGMRREDLTQPPSHLPHLTGGVPIQQRMYPCLGSVGRAPHSQWVVLKAGLGT